MAKRVGCVLVFREGTTKVMATRAIAALKGMLEVPAEKWVDGPPIAVGPNRGCKTSERVPFETEDLIQEYDDEFGGPVWYIP